MSVEIVVPGAWVSVILIASVLVAWVTFWWFVVRPGLEWFCRRIWDDERETS